MPCIHPHVPHETHGKLTNDLTCGFFLSLFSYRCWRVHDKYLCSVDKKHFEEFHVYYQKCNSCPHDRAHCGNLIMEREASKLFPWRCNVCAQQEFMDKTGRYKTEGNKTDRTSAVWSSKLRLLLSLTHLFSLDFSRW